jgi:NTE family protein
MKVLYLASGAAHGAYQAGVLKALDQTTWRPDLVMGVSVGAINGAGWVAGRSGRELCQIWEGLKTPMVYRPRPFWDWLKPWTWNYLVDTSPLQRFVESHVNLEALYKSPYEFIVSGLNIRSGHSHLFTTKPQNALESIPTPYMVSRLDHESILASGAIPGVFQPRHGDVWDGAFAQQQPFKPLVHRGMTEIVLVHMQAPYQEDRHIPKGPLETAWRIADLATSLPRAKDFGDLLSRNTMEGYRFIKTLEIRPDLPLKYSRMNFSSPLKKDAMAQGYRDGLASFSKYLGV